MIWPVIFVGIGFSLVILVSDYFSSVRQREIYESLISLLEKDRDYHKNEAKVFRGLLFPVLVKADISGAAAPTSLADQSRPGQGVKAADSPSVAPNPLTNRRIPFRIRFKQGAKLFNSKQVGTDALAGALSQQKPKEPSNE